MKTHLLFPLIAIITFLNTCTENPINGDNNIPPGRRDYVWAIDTIQSGSIQTYLTSMWGSSSQNVWVSGYDADNAKCIYLFNGTQWSPVIIPSTNFIKQFYAMEGSNSNNIFFVGRANYFNPSPPPNFLDSAFVLQYLNGSWIIHNISDSTSLFALCLVNENEVWAGGAKGNLFRFSGINWEKYFVGNEDVLINGLVSINSNEVFATGHQEKFIPGQGAYLADYLYKYNGTVWALIDSNITSNNYNRKSFPTLLRSINGNIYGSGEIGFVKKAGDSWQAIKTDIHGQFNGTDENNIFLANQDFGVLHYNGKDWHRFDELPWLSYYDVEVFDDAVFLLASDGAKSYVVKGTLN